jgi:glutamate dehydrogenase/leucine dehydrogenase
MTYKNAMAGLAAGGGKSVVLAPERIADREALFRAHGRCVEMLGGVYTTAEDADYVANAGGVITGFGALSGHPPEWGTRRVDAIYDTVLEVLRRADAEGIPPHMAADVIAEARITTANGL